MEALKDDVIRAELQGRDSVADLKRILKIEISDIKSYKSRKCHPALTKAQDDKARQQSAYFKRACDAHEGQDKLENDHYLYKMYSRLVSLYKKRVKDLQSALKNGNYPKIKQILNEKPIR